MKARLLLEAADPALLKLVCQAFDEAWQTIAGNYSEAHAEAARMRLATHVLCIAREPGCDLGTLRDNAVAAVERDEQPLKFATPHKQN